MARNNGNIVNMTEGDPKRLILWFTLPMLLGNLFQQFYNWVDCIIVDKFVGDDALAAVGATSSVNFFFFAISNGIGTGVGIVVAQFFGAKRDEDVRRTIANSVYVVGEYSCAVTPQIRQAGNRLSGLAGTAYASLLA